MAAAAVRVPRDGAADHSEPGATGAVPHAPGTLVATRQRVVTSDGYELGELAEVSEAHMRVDVPLKQDAWFYLDDVAEARSRLVVLKFPRAELEAHSLNEPQPVDGLLSPEERAEQRKAMEEELAEQHERLPDDAPHSPYHVGHDR
jgi:hypothetical protein